MPDLPPVSSPGDAFLAAIAVRQERTNELLAQLLDRMPKPVAMLAPGVVELREPHAPQGATEVTEERDDSTTSPAPPGRKSTRRRKLSAKETP